MQAKGGSTVYCIRRGFTTCQWIKKYPFDFRKQMLFRESFVFQCTYVVAFLQMNLEYKSELSCILLRILKNIYDSIDRKLEGPCQKKIIIEGESRKVQYWKPYFLGSRWSKRNSMIMVNPLGSTAATQRPPMHGPIGVWNLGFPFKNCTMTDLGSRTFGIET